jgi:hypothetical protein
MASIRKERATDIAESVYTLYRDKAGDWRRNHLGASIIGHRCDRYLWLSFRWVADPKHEGRLLRLFERGQREEDWLIEDLRRAGFTVTSQDCVERIEREGHIGGSLDGIISGLPESPSEIHVLEIKTSNLKQWGRLRDKGVRSAKPVHYVQMQLYMHKMKLSHALYVSVCKDNDEIYSERVSYSEKTAEKHLGRARAAVESEAPPARLDPSFPPCVLVSQDGTRWPCQFFDVCHGKQMPERSCRTCVESKPVVDSNGDPVWTCGLDPKNVVPLSPSEQRRGCSSQITILNTVNADVSSVDLLARTVTYQFSDGTKFTEL